MDLDADSSIATTTEVSLEATAYTSADRADLLFVVGDLDVHLD